ncbi:MAG: hypothetical protein ACC662_11695 [Planctomycetota bacterium]
MGREKALFEELLQAPDRTPAQVYAAARRVGLDLGALKSAAAGDPPPPFLVRTRKIMLSANLEVLPTPDIGRRRLMGAQSEAELRAALAAAGALSRAQTP